MALGVIDATEDAAYVADVPDPNDIIRKAIIAEFERRKLNPYQLWKLVEGDGVSRATVHNFVRGKTTISTEHASTLLRALGIAFAPSLPKKSKRSEK